MKAKRIIGVAAAVVLVFSVIAAIIGCTTGTGVSSGALYMTDTFNGRVYTFDMDSNTASSVPVLSTGQNATGTIYFYNDIGYIAVGNSPTTDAPGVYRFDPNAAVPVAERIGESISAQYIAFYSLTKAYVTDADYFASTGVYSFNPLDPDAGLSGPIPGTDDMAGGMYLQDITTAGDMVYVADNGNAQVLVIDPTTDTLAASSPIPASAGGTTGLLTVRDSDGSALVYVANSPYDAMFNPLPGSIDVIDTSTNTLTQVVSNVSATQIEYDSVNDSFFGTGYTNTYRIDPASGTAVEIKDRDNQPFGGTDIVASGGKVYISNTDYTSSKLYILDGATGAETAESPVSIMADGEDAVAGLAVY